MQKTKLGISVGLMGALAYFSGLFSGYMIAVIIAGYVLIAEENVWLKKTCVKAIALMIGFSVISALLEIIPDFIGLINGLFTIFGKPFYLKLIGNIFTFLHSVINFAEKIIFLILGVKALNQGTVRIPVIDDLINKYMD